MAVRAICCVAVPLSTLLIAGCGTVANLACSHPDAGGKSPFGGVKHDVCCMKQAANGEFGVTADCTSESAHSPQAAAMLFCAADLPFTFVGDLVTWPYTAAYSFINQPVPVPPVTLTTVVPALPVRLAPETKEPEKKTPGKDTDKGDQSPDKKTPEKDDEKGKDRDDKSAPKPPAPPQPRNLIP